MNRSAGTSGQCHAFQTTMKARQAVTTMVPVTAMP